MWVSGVREEKYLKYKHTSFIRKIEYIEILNWCGGKMQTKKLTALIILDGWGVAPPSKGNAITLAKTPAIDRLYELYPSTTLGATGKDVGLPDRKMSGSEAGHMNIGAGRIVEQDEKYINESIDDGSFFLNPAMTGAMRHTKKTGSKENSEKEHSETGRKTCPSDRRETGS